MSLVDDNVLPTEFPKGRFLSHTHFVRCDEDIEFLREDNVGNDACLAYQYVKYWTISLDLLGPLWFPGALWS
jgi:hypothetical protein